MKNSVVAVVPAAGTGIRMGGTVFKQYLTLDRIPLVTYTCLILENIAEIESIVIVVPPGEHIEFIDRYLRPYYSNFRKKCKVIEGGKLRQNSVYYGCLAAKELGAVWVVIHDAVRPLAKPDLFSRVIASAQKFGAAITALPSVDTIKEVDDLGFVVRTLNRSNLWLIQTPQAFQLNLLLQAQKYAEMYGLIATDESTFIEAIGHRVKLVIGDRDNIKVTTPEDLQLAKILVGEFNRKMKIGHGLDVHKFVSGRSLILGGVSIEYKLGLIGHSDADVLTHAVIDAILAAASLGDIGRIFPDSDINYKDINSLILLNRVRTILAETGWMVAQISIIIISQEPKLAFYIERIRINLARILGVNILSINIAASSTEGLGFVGRVEGVAVSAIATLISVL